MTLDLLLLDQARRHPGPATPFPGRLPVAVSVERNTIRLEGQVSCDDPLIQARVQEEVEHTAAFLEAGIPVSITCYVGGARCTKQGEMLGQLLGRNPAWAGLITPHLTCNFTPDDTARYLAQLRGQGIRRLLCVSGDKLDPRFKTFSRHPDLRSAPQLVAMAHSLGRESTACDTGSAGSAFTISVAYSSFNGASPSTEQRKMYRKREAGAHAVKTQPVTYADAAFIDRDHAFLSTLFPQEGISWSVICYQSAGMAERMHDRYHVRVPGEVINRLTLAEHLGKNDSNPKARVLSEGLHIAAQSIAYLVHSGARSINIMGVRKPSTYHKLVAFVPGYVEAYARGRMSMGTGEQLLVQALG